MMDTLKRFIEAYKKTRNHTAALALAQCSFQPDYPRDGFYVYALIDPRTQEIFYIGKGIGDRLRRHNERARRGVIENSLKTERIREIIAQGYALVTAVLWQGGSEEEALAVEEGLTRDLAPLGLCNIVGCFSTRTPKVVNAANSLRGRIHRFHAAMAGAGA